MMIKNNERKKQMDQYLKILNNIEWHHPDEFKTPVPTKPPKEMEDYYLSQLCFILLNNYQRSMPQVESILNINRTKIFRLTQKYQQDYTSFAALNERINDGQDW